MSNKNCPPKKSCKCNDAGEVIYTGLDLPCIPAETGDTVNEIFTAIDAKLCDLVACCADSTFTTNDTPSIDLTGDGTPGSPLMADAIISPQPGNTLVILPDGLFTSGGGAGVTELVYGGIVTWTGVGYIYDVSAAGYFINGTFYTSPATQITLDPADPTFDRFDAFIVNTGSIATKITGDPTADPLQPSIDPATQLALTYVLVQAGSLTPAQDECLYQENTEWTSFSSTARIVMNDPSDPFAGSVSIEGTAVENGDFFTLTNGSTIEPFAYTKLNLKLKSYGSWGDNGLIFQFYNGVTPIGSAVPIVSGSFGFDDTQTSTYQNIDIPISSFGIVSQQDVDRLRVTAQNPTLGTFDWNIDNICLLVSPYVSPPFVNLIFQSGTKRVGNIVELGINWGGYANPNTGPINSWLHHDTAINTAGHTLYHTGAPVWKPITEDYQQQTFGISTDIATFLSAGTVKVTEPDNNNRVRLHIGYTGQNYQDDEIMWGYMQDRIGYWMGTNLFGAGSFGIQLDNKDSKTTGVFMHTYDSGTDAVTIFGAPPNLTNILHDLPLSVTGENLIKDRIALFKTDKDIQLFGYPNTRDDGDATRFLTTDANGNLELRDFDYSTIGVLLTADNGLTKNTPTNVQWGGSLLQNTAIDGNGFNINFIGDNAEFFLTDMRFQMDKGANVLSANDLTLGGDGNVFVITGNTQVNAITTADWQAGSVVYLLFNGAAKTVKHNTAGGAGTAPILLAGSTDLITDNFTVLTLVYNGTEWEETSRKFSSAVGSYLFRNGLTESPVGITEWGGTLLHNTTITQGGFDSIFSTGRVLMTNARFETDLGVELAAANDLTLGTDGNVFPISGATQINAITTANWQAGSEVILEFVSTPTIKHNTAGGAGTAPIFLAGGVDYVAAANDILHLVYDGNSWHEVSRKLAAVAPFTGITADNGIYEEPVQNNVQLGSANIGDSTLSSNRYINTTAFALELYSSTTTPFRLTTLTNATAFQAFSTGEKAARLISGDATTNSIITVLEIERNSSSTPATGMGGAIDFSLETSDLVPNVVSSRIISKWTNAASATSTADLEFWTRNSNTSAKKATLAGSGQWTWDTYGSGTHTGTAARYLAVTAAGLVIEEAVPGVSANNGLTENVANNIQLGGTLINATTTIDAGTNLFIGTSTFADGAVNSAFTFNNTLNTASLTVGLKGTATGTNSSSCGVAGIHSGVGVGVYGNTSSGAGVLGISSSGFGGEFRSTSGTGLSALSNTGVAGIFTTFPATTNTVVDTLRLVRSSSGSAANGIGAALTFYMEDTSTQSNEAARIVAIWQDVTTATRTSDMQFHTVNSATSGLALTLTSDKKVVTTGRVLGTQGADVASVAGAITLGAGNVFEITGTNNITLISNVGWQNGSEVTLVFTSTASVASGTATSGTDITIILAGGATFNATADDTLTLVLCEVGGTQAWREKCRSVN